MVGTWPQDASAPAAPLPVAAGGTDLVALLQALGWVDVTALSVLFAFFVLGLFKGLIWQVSRVGILLAAYAVCARFGGSVGEWLARSPSVGGDPLHQGDTPETMLYVAYVLVFVGVLVVLSLLAILLQRLAARAGLGFFDRLGGGLLGVATGACVVLFGISLVHMFFRGSQLAAATDESHSLRLSRTAIDWLGPNVPDELRTVFALQPLRSPAPAGGDGLPGTAPAGDAPVALPAPGAEPDPAPGGGAPPDEPPRPNAPGRPRR
jgi:membrane protein required for colicin V production